MIINTKSSSSSGGYDEKFPDTFTQISSVTLASDSTSETLVSNGNYKAIVLKTGNASSSSSEGGWTLNINGYPLAYLRYFVRASSGTTYLEVRTDGETLTIMYRGRDNDAYDGLSDATGNKVLSYRDGTFIGTNTLTLQCPKYTGITIDKAVVFESAAPYFHLVKLNTLMDLESIKTVTVSGSVAWTSGSTYEVFGAV